MTEITENRELADLPIVPAARESLVAATNNGGTVLHSVDSVLGLLGAEDVSFTPSGGLASANVSDALEELDSEKLNISGSNVTDKIALLQAIGLDLVGMGFDFWGSTAPAGTLFAHGQAVSRTTYSALFAKLGTTHGAGDGSTTFNLPDKRGRVSAGKDDMGGTSANRLTSPINGDNLGASGGSESHTLTIAQMPQHNHSVTDNIVSALSDVGGSFNYQTAAGSFAFGNPTFSTGNQGNGDAHNNVQPTIVCNYVIFTGVF